MQATLHTLSTVALVGLVSIAIVTDLRTRRIPNVLTVTGLFLALLLRAVPGGDPLAPGFLGAGIAFALSFPLVLLGGLGGGDAKLLTAVGAFLGPAGLPMALLVTALVGGAMAVAVATRRGALGETLAHSWGLVARLARRDRQPPRTLSTPGVLAVPYGVAIGAGALAGWLL